MYNIEFSDEFKAQVLKALGKENDERFIEDLNEYGHLASMYLNAAALAEFTAEEIIKANESGNMPQIIEEAKRRLLCAKLYEEWRRASNQERRNRSGR